MLVLPSLALLISLELPRSVNTPVRVVEPPFANRVDDRVLARASASMAPAHLSSARFAALEASPFGGHFLQNRHAFQDNSTTIEAPSRRAGLSDYATLLTGTSTLQYDDISLTDSGVQSVSIRLQFGTLHFRGLGSGVGL